MGVYVFCRSNTDVVMVSSWTKFYQTKINISTLIYFCWIRPNSKKLRFNTITVCSSYVSFHSRCFSFKYYYILYMWRGLHQKRFRTLNGFSSVIILIPHGLKYCRYFPYKF